MELGRRWNSLELDMICNENCLAGMPRIPNQSIDLVLCDLPYGTTDSAWDSIIPLAGLWEQYERIIKPKGAIALFASGQFACKLMKSNERLYKYKWIWVKSRKGNFVNAKNRPMTNFEEILVFSLGSTANGSLNKMNYYPQGLEPCGKTRKNGESKFGAMAGKRPSHKNETVLEFTGYPSDAIYFESVAKPIHPTQKPVPLLEYLIRTYTSEGGVVLDNCFGSGSTLVAAAGAKRHYIGFELDERYFGIARQRLNEVEGMAGNAAAKPAESLRS
jgi:site-specific DNA-methyltransferase (adenine-specific)